MFRSGGCESSRVLLRPAISKEAETDEAGEQHQPSRWQGCRGDAFAHTADTTASRGYFVPYTKHVRECATDQKCKSATAIVPNGEQCILTPFGIVRDSEDQPIRIDRDNRIATVNIRAAVVTKTRLPAAVITIAAVCREGDQGEVERIGTEGNGACSAICLPAHHVQRYSCGKCRGSEIPTEIVIHGRRVSRRDHK